MSGTVYERVCVNLGCQVIESAGRSIRPRQTDRHDRQTDSQSVRETDKTNKSAFGSLDLAVADVDELARLAKLEAEGDIGPLISYGFLIGQSHERNKGRKDEVTHTERATHPVVDREGPHGHPRGGEGGPSVGGEDVPVQDRHVSVGSVLDVGARKRYYIHLRRNSKKLGKFTHRRSTRLVSSM